MSAMNRLFREMEFFEPPAYLWSRISVGLDREEPASRDWFSNRVFTLGKPGWLRLEVWALAATLVIGLSVAFFHWSAVRAEAQQLAEIDRTYHALLPQNAESYNPFATSPWNNTKINPFRHDGPDTGSSPSRTLEKR